LVTGAETIPLRPRRRLIGSPFGGFTSVRRGEGTDIASSRPYESGDRVHAIDWKASARLSAAHGNDEFIVRERHAEEMSRVVLVVDRRPSMALYPAELPWLHKPRAVELAARILVTSTVNQRGLLGYLDLASHDAREAGTPFWQRPRAQAGTWQGDLAEQVTEHLGGDFDAPDDNLDLALTYLATGVRGSLPLGTFVFVVSDFTAPLSPAPWIRAAELGWDVVPIVVQDPVWEQSFPEIQGVLTPFADPGRNTLRLVRLDARQVQERRRANETRLRSLLTDFAGLGLDAVLVESSDPDAVYAALLSWADSRIELRASRA
jgi:Protein of unknown function DUF58